MALGARGLAVAVLALAGCDGKIEGNSDIDYPDGPAPTSCESPADQGERYFVSPDGSDESGDGSEASPWATIGHGFQNISDGSTLVVGAGTYQGRVRLDRQFEQGVVIRSEPAYAAKLRNDGMVVTVYEGQGITLRGFDIAHDGPGAGPLVIQIQDLLGDGSGEGGVSRIVLTNNILHDSYNNDILKINNGARDVLVERNVFYNQQGSDEHIDVNSVADVAIHDNIFFNDFEASGRSNEGETSSFIVIKDSNGDDDAFEGAQNISVRRNVFANYQGNAGTNFILVGEDGNPYYEATDVLIENNLLIGNSENQVRAPFGVKGGSDVLFRHNTIVGDMPGVAFAFRFNQEGDNLPNQNIAMYNNIWSDPTGTMGNFSTTPMGETASFSLRNNVYWNNGQAIPSSDSELINVSDDDAAILGDPGISAGTSVMPTWDEAADRFRDGSGDICLAFERLVEEYGTPSPGGAADGVADAEHVPELDILGRPRAAQATAGAVEIP